MARERTFVCSHCRYLIQARALGRPYALSAEGRPQPLRRPAGAPPEGHAAPSAVSAPRAGYLSDLLCVDCGSTFQLDLKKQTAVCPRRKCGSQNVFATWDLKGKPCPRCKTGRFKRSLLNP